MANAVRPTSRRNAEVARRRTQSGAYVDGNTVRRLQTSPDRRNRRNVPSAGPRRKKQNVSKTAQRNRVRAKSMNRGFVLFLTVISVAILFCCINYLQMKAEITAKSSNIAALETELSQLREDNDAYYSQVTSSVDLDKIKKIAIGRLGMKYPSKEQIVTYKTTRSSYVRQYQDVPDADR